MSKKIGIEEMWSLFTSYKELTKSTPVLVEDYVGKDGKRVHREREKPLTLEGFELYVIDVKGCLVSQYFYGGNAGDYTDYKAVCKRIQMTIRHDQIIGGMCNVYHPGITARLNGLVDKTEENGSKDINIKVKYERKGDSTEPTS